MPLTWCSRAVRLEAPCSPSTHRGLAPRAVTPGAFRPSLRAARAPPAPARFRPEPQLKQNTRPAATAERPVIASGPMLRTLHLLVLAAVTTLGIASSATTVSAETALRADREISQARVPGFADQARETHQQNALGYGGCASDACLAARAGALAGRRLGHTFAKHGAENTAQLLKQAAGSGKPVGQWLNNAAAERFIAERLGQLKNGAQTFDLPPGLGRVVNPNGTFSAASKARLVPSGSGVKTAFPLIE